MTTVVHVTCYRAASLREKIVNDPKLAAFGLEVERKQKPGRNPGWAKLYAKGIDGSINLEWDLQTRTLLARIVNRGTGRPPEITGQFVKLLLARHSANIRSIQIQPDV
jgi:hypothetical protein